MNPAADRLRVVGDTGQNLRHDVTLGTTTVDLSAYATLRVGSSYRMYEITLFSGKAELTGTFRPFSQVMDIAMPLNQLWRQLGPNDHFRRYSCPRRSRREARSLSCSEV